MTQLNLNLIVHDFATSLERSHKAADWPGWEPLYRDHFPTLLSLCDHRQDGEHQRAGIDRSLTLANSKQLLVDEKVRGRNKNTGHVYDDVFLEIWSDKERNVPGWMVKPLRADYIAYLIAPLGVCYLLPVLQLQLAWARHGAIWIKEFGTRDVMNRDWITVGVPVPVAPLYAAMGGGLRSRFTPWEVEE